MVILGDALYGRDLRIGCPLAHVDVMSISISTIRGCRSPFTSSKTRNKVGSGLYDRTFGGPDHLKHFSSPSYSTPGSLQRRNYAEPLQPCPAGNSGRGSRETGPDAEGGKRVRSQLWVAIG